MPFRARLSRYSERMFASRVQGTSPLAAVTLTLIALVATPSTPTARSPQAAIAFGTRHAVALGANGDVLTWGENVSCQLGRASRGNAGRTPTLVMRNAAGIAAAADHTLVLTTDGKVYGWGQNAEGSLGMGNTYDQCDGPALVESLAGQTVAQIATGHGFSMAVTTSGDLFCSGDNSMGQCPVGRTGRVEAFTKLALPELTGNVAAVRAGGFHSLIVTKDGKLYALGRGREGQLGHGRMTNGLALVPDLTDVVSFAAGTWHSVAARADGTAWVWGHGAKSQLCDGNSVNRATPAPVALPPDVRVAAVAAGGHGTMLRATDGTLFGCGDNQFGPLGLAATNVSQPTPIPAPPVKSGVIALGAANGALSVDGCSVSLAGANEHGLVSAADTAGVRAFSPRAGLSLCGSTPAAPLPTIVNPVPRGGVSNCWTTRLQEDAAASPRFAGLRAAMLAAEGLLKANAAFLAAPQPVRLRTSLSAGPLDGGGARMHIKAVPERKPDGTRLWATTGCEVIPQIDRIGGAIAQVSIFFNQDARGQFISPVGRPPTRTGTVAGYPEYNGWVLITRDQRVPWLPQTLADLLDEEHEKRERALAEARTRPAGLVPDTAAGGVTWLEKQVRDLREYRAAFPAQALRAPGVWGDPTGEGRKRLDAEAAALRRLSAADEQQLEALRLARAPDRAVRGREIQQAHMARVTPLIIDALATYDLTNLRPGTAEQAMRAKPDPSFPDVSAPNRVQVIAVMFSFGPKPAGAQLDWQTRTIAEFDFAALAALLQ